MKNKIKKEKENLICKENQFEFISRNIKNRINLFESQSLSSISLFSFQKSNINNLQPIKRFKTSENIPKLKIIMKIKIKLKRN